MTCASDAYHETMENAAKDPAREKQVIINKNLVWSILQSSPFVGDNTELAELMMSLTGTIIVDKNSKITQVPSMADNGELIRALLGTSGSNQAQIWRCDESTHCLNVHLSTITLPETRALSGRIRTLIRSIDEKIKSDVKLSSTETGFLEMTSLPVLKFLLVLNSTHSGNAAVDIEGYSTLIASDLLQQYLSHLLQAVSMAAMSSTLPDDLLRELRQRIEKANTKVAAIEPQVGHKLTEKLALIQNITRAEKQLATSFNTAGAP
jgi:conjugative transfer pilus assembly protein TraH